MGGVNATDVALLTDLYQLTMATGYFHRGLKHTRATCEMFVRRLPAARRYLVACGIEQAVEGILAMRFDDASIDYLKSVPALADAIWSTTSRATCATFASVARSGPSPRAR